MKLLLKGFGFLALFVIVCAIAFLVLVDPNEFKGEIEQQVAQSTGRMLTIGGDIGLSIFPIGLELNEVTLSNAAGFEQAHFASIDSLVIKADLIPLLQQQLVVDALRLDGLSLHLEVDADGNNNWQDLASAGEQQEVATEAQPVTSSDSSHGSLAALAINGIAINDANVSYDNRQENSRVLLRDFSLTTGAIAFAEPFDVSLRARLEQSTAGVEQAVDVAIDTALIIEQSLQQFVIDGLTLALTANLPDFEALELGVSLGAEIDLATETASIKDGAVDVFDNTLGLELVASGWSGDLAAEGKLATGDLQPRELASRLGVVLPPMQAADALVSLNLTAPFSMQAGKFSAQPDIRFDETNIAAELDVTLATQAVRYRLDIDNIDVNRYMPPPPPEGTEPAASAAATAAAEEPLPIPAELIHTLDVAGDLSIGEVSVLDYQLSSVKATTTIKNGVVSVSPVALDVFKGKVNADAKMDVRKELPEFKLVLSADEIHPGGLVDPILKTVIKGQDVNMTGTGDVTVDMATRGMKLSELIQSSNGQFGFRFVDSKLDGLDVDQFGKAMVKQAIDEAGNPLGYSHDYNERYDPETKTAFDIMRGDFAIKQGIAVSDNLFMDGSKARVTGKAKLDVNQMVLDSTITANRKIASPKSDLERLEQEPISLRVHGPLSQLKYDPDYSEVGSAIARAVQQKLNEAIDKKKAELKQKVDDKLDTPKIDAKKQELDEKKDELKDKLKQKLKLF